MRFLVILANGHPETVEAEQASRTRDGSLVFYTPGLRDKRYGPFDWRECHRVNTPLHLKG